MFKTIGILVITGFHTALAIVHWIGHLVSSGILSLTHLIVLADHAPQYMGLTVEQMHALLRSIQR
jgi:hypothetical protein